MMFDYKTNPFSKPFYKLYKWATSNRYTIGILEFDEEIVSLKPNNSSLKYHWIKDDYKRGWFADPFILDVSNNYMILLVEEFVYKLHRGVISKLVI